ncbi:hypothetical protein BHM03_00034845 [Ensete ventricosum]|nr:hypothetical protein BHM03_00034845 [Ensete ventricosum]
MDRKIVIRKEKITSLFSKAKWCRRRSLLPNQCAPSTGGKLSTLALYASASCQPFTPTPRRSILHGPPRWIRANCTTLWSPHSRGPEEKQIDIISKGPSLEGESSTGRKGVRPDHREKAFKNEGRTANLLQGRGSHPLYPRRLAVHLDPDIGYFTKFHPSCSASRFALS